MSKNCIILLASFLSFSFNVHSQNIYPESFQGCNTEMFSLESKTPRAIISTRALTKLISDTVDDKILQEIAGVLRIQIIAYEDNSSCLLSYENRTTMLDQEINMTSLKQVIDEQLIWDSVTETTSPLIELHFKKGKIRLKRMGFDGDRGLHELKD